MLQPQSQAFHKVKSNQIQNASPFHQLVSFEQRRRAKNFIHNVPVRSARQSNEHDDGRVFSYARPDFFSNHLSTESVS